MKQNHAAKIKDHADNTLLLLLPFATTIVGIVGGAIGGAALTSVTGPGMLVGAVVGAVIGGVLGLFLGVVSLYYILKKKYLNKNNKDNHTYTSMVAEGEDRGYFSFTKKGT